MAQQVKLVLPVIQEQSVRLVPRATLALSVKPALPDLREIPARVKLVPPETRVLKEK